MFFDQFRSLFYILRKYNLWIQKNNIFFFMNSLKFIELFFSRKSGMFRRREPSPLSCRFQKLTLQKLAYAYFTPSLKFTLKATHLVFQRPGLSPSLRMQRTTDWPGPRACSWRPEPSEPCWRVRDFRVPIFTLFNVPLSPKNFAASFSKFHPRGGFFFSEKQFDYYC